MTTKRPAPYIWVTWLSRYLAGEMACTWALWFKAHYTKFDKVVESFDIGAWNATHAELLRSAAAARLAEGYAVRLEDQNAFHARSASGTVVAGRPDLIALNDEMALIEECKTGVPKVSDILQVQIYLALFPFIRPAYRGLRAVGRIRYRHQVVDIPSDSIDETFRGRLREAVAMLAGDVPPIRVPSPRICAWCDIGPMDCPDRSERSAVAVITHHDLF